MPNVVVTGATGFVGGAVVGSLVSSGAAVFGVARHRLSVGADPARTELGFAGIDLAATDATDKLEHAVSPLHIDVVVHAAGLAHRRASADEFDVHNAAATLRVLQWAARAGVSRVVLISSASVYPASGDARTEVVIPAPITAYGLSKLAAEEHACRVAALHGIELVILRLATAYGRGDPGNVGRLLRAVSTGRFLPVGSGRNRKSLIHVDDSATIVSAVALLSRPISGIYNVSTGWNDLREIVAAARAASHRAHAMPWITVPRQGGLVRGLSALGSARLVGAQRVLMPFKTWLSDDAIDGRSLATVLADQFPTAVPLVDGFREAIGGGG